MTLDQELQEALVVLEEMERKLDEERLDAIMELKNKYPEDEIRDVAIECAKEQRIKNNEQISSIRNEYNSLTSFKEKQEFYNNKLASRELGFRVVSEKLNKFINNPKINPYEEWAGVGTLESIERKGIKATVLDELLFGNLT